MFFCHIDRFSIAEVSPVFFESKSAFLQDLKTIQIYQTGSGCPVETLQRLHEGLTFALPQSYIYVFTDSTHNDHLGQEPVIHLVENLQASVRNPLKS